MVMTVIIKERTVVFSSLLLSSLELSDKKVYEPQIRGAYRLPKAHLVRQDAVDVLRMQRPEPVQPHLGV